MEKARVHVCDTSVAGSERIVGGNFGVYIMFRLFDLSHKCTTFPELGVSGLGKKLSKGLF